MRVEILRILDLAFEERWIYLFELLQNAIDLGADAVRFRADEHSLLFEHNAPIAFSEAHVRALSAIFHSKKPFRSVGFMGIGFKSVFCRFRTVHVGDADWRFNFHVETTVGPDGDVQPDPLATVLPQWDDEAPVPGTGYTTSFRLTHPFSNGGEDTADVTLDLPKLFPNDDETLLAVLALAGLRTLELQDETWALSVVDESASRLVTAARAGAPSARWRAFTKRYKPTKAASAALLEARRVPRDDKRARHHARSERAVVGLLPLAEDGTPRPPERGRLFATLPTEETAPLGLHLQADWLLNISRTGLRHVEDNAWQRDIIDAIPGVVRQFGEWLIGAGFDETGARAAYRVFQRLPDEPARPIDATLTSQSWRDSLKSQLESLPLLLCVAGAATAFTWTRPAASVLPPSEDSDLGNDPKLRGDLLLGAPVVAPRAIGVGALSLFRQLSLLSDADPARPAAEWQARFGRWWASQGDDKVQSLLRVWTTLSRASDRDKAWATIPCAVTEAGSWQPLKALQRIDDQLPSETELSGAEVLRWLANVLPRADAMLLPAVANVVRTLGAAIPARLFYERNSSATTLRELIEARCAEPVEPRDAAHLAVWARNRRRADLVPYVITTGPDGLQLDKPERAVVADPYAAAERRKIFPKHRPVSEIYFDLSGGSDAAAWITFFHQCGCVGNLRVVDRYKRHVGRKDHRALAAALNVDETALETLEANSSGYQVFDFDFDVEWGAVDAAALAAWIREDPSPLRGTGRLVARFKQGGPRVKTGTSPASWVQRLHQLPWVPTETDRRLPQDVLARSDLERPDGALAKLDERAVAILEGEGIRFGTNIARAKAIRRLQVLGVQLNSGDLARLLEEAVGALSADSEAPRQLYAVVNTLTLPHGSNRVALPRVVARTGAPARSGLGGFVVGLNELDEQLAAALRKTCAALRDAGFDVAFAPGTSGAQALEFLRDVWRRASHGAEGLADEVRDYLPSAYRYVLDDIEDGDVQLAAIWRTAATDAKVAVTKGSWVSVQSSPSPVLDDLTDDLVRLHGSSDFRTVVAGHLGDEREAQVRVAQALKIALLSEKLKCEWHEGTELRRSDWESRFALVDRLLRAAAERSDQPALALKCRANMSVVVNGASHDVFARLRGHELVVAGEPTDFGADAGSALIDHYRIQQQAKLAVRATALMMFLDDWPSFKAAATAFATHHAPATNLNDDPLWLAATAAAGPAIESDTSARASSSAPNSETVSAPTVPPLQSSSPAPATSGMQQAASQPPLGRTTSTESPVGTSGEHDTGRPFVVREGAPHSQADNEQSWHPSAATYTVEKKAQQLHALIRRFQDAGISPHEDPNLIGPNSDAVFRGAVVAYEESQGRSPMVKDFSQAGFDMDSYSHPEGHSERRLVRRIEVKGRNSPWMDEEIVCLSSAQFRHALSLEPNAHGIGDDFDYWLYVVDRCDTDAFFVRPIRNPPKRLTTFSLVASLWLVHVENARRVRMTASGGVVDASIDDGG